MNGSIALIKKTPGSPFHLWLSELGKVTVSLCKLIIQKTPDFVTLISRRDRTAEEGI
jgi:hypothetical protein